MVKQTCSTRRNLFVIVAFGHGRYPMALGGNLGKLENVPGEFLLRRLPDLELCRKASGFKTERASQIEGCWGR